MMLKSKFRNTLLQNVEAALPSIRCFEPLPKKQASKALKIALPVGLTSAMAATLAVVLALTMSPKQTPKTVPDGYDPYTDGELGYGGYESFYDFATFEKCVNENSAYTQEKAHYPTGFDFDVFTFNPEEVEKLIPSNPEFEIRGAYVNMEDALSDAWQRAIERASVFYSFESLFPGLPPTFPERDDYVINPRAPDFGITYSLLLYEGNANSNLVWQKEYPREWFGPITTNYVDSVNREVKYFWYTRGPGGYQYASNMWGFPIADYRDVTVNWSDDWPILTQYLIDETLGQVVCVIEYRNVNILEGVSDETKAAHALIEDLKDAVYSDVKNNYGR